MIYLSGKDLDHDLSVRCGRMLQRYSRRRVFEPLPPGRPGGPLIAVRLTSWLLRPFVMRDFFLRLQTAIFFRVQFWFCPVKRGNRAGSSRNESVHSQRGTQTSFPLLESRSCKNFGLYRSFFNCVVRKLTLDQNGRSVWSTLIFYS